MTAGITAVAHMRVVAVMVLATGGLVEVEAVSGYGEAFCGGQRKDSRLEYGTDLSRNCSGA